MLAFQEMAEAEENLAAMQEMADAMSTIEVTYAVRDTMMDGKSIEKNDYMAISGKSIVANGKDLTSVIAGALKEVVTEDSALVTLYYGQEITEESAEAMAELLEPYFPEVEIEVVFGGQPVYYYFISVE